MNVAPFVSLCKRSMRGVRENAFVDTCPKDAINRSATKLYLQTIEIRIFGLYRSTNALRIDDRPKPRVVCAFSIKKHRLAAPARWRLVSDSCDQPAYER